jgi:hypothetical protein
MDDLPAAPTGGIEVGDLVRRSDTAASAGPVVDAGVAGDRPPPWARVSLRLKSPSLRMIASGDRNHGTSLAISGSPLMTHHMLAHPCSRSVDRSSLTTGSPASARECGTTLSQTSKP